MWFVKKSENMDVVRAVSMMVGYIVGVGMFGLPFVVAKSGVLVFVIFIVLYSGVQYFLHLVYANLIVTNQGYHRLPGYAEMYFGKKGKYFLFAAKMSGNLGALLAYLIISGIFMHQLLSPIFGMSEFFYGTILFLLGALVVYGGIGVLASFELGMSVLLIIVVTLISIKGFGAIKLENYHLYDLTYLFMPYGALLMALDGLGSIPTIAKFLKKDAKLMKKTIFWGTLISVVVTVFFVFAIVGITGANTTPDALIGLGQTIDGNVVILALVFGLLAMSTSYLSVTEAVKEVLAWDFRVGKKLSWSIAVLVPYTLYALGVTNLTKVIGFAGGVAGGFSSIMMILIFRKIRQKKHHLPIFDLKPKDAFLFFLIGLFVVGAAYEISKIF